MATFPEPVDIHVGARLRQRRVLLGLSQEKLAGAIGLTFQQLQKYESGANRVSSSRLYQLAGLLGVAVPYFFEDLSPDAPEASGTLESNDADLISRRETLKFMRAYNRISDADVRGHVSDLINTLADVAAAKSKAGASQPKAKRGKKAGERAASR